MKLQNTTHSVSPKTTSPVFQSNALLSPTRTSVKHALKASITVSLYVSSVLQLELSLIVAATILILTRGHRGPPLERRGRISAALGLNCKYRGYEALRETSIEARD